MPNLSNAFKYFVKLLFLLGSRPSFSNCSRVTLASFLPPMGVPGSLISRPPLPVTVFDAEIETDFFLTFGDSVSVFFLTFGGVSALDFLTVLPLLVAVTLGKILSASLDGPLLPLTSESLLAIIGVFLLTDSFLFLPAPDFPFVASAILSKILFPERFCLARGLLIAMILSNSRKSFFGTLLLQPRQNEGI